MEVLQYINHPLQDPEFKEELGNRNHIERFKALAPNAACVS